MAAIDRDTGSMTGTRVHAFTDDDALGHDDATGVAQRLRMGEISAVEALDAAMARLDRVDDVLGGLRFPDFERARARALAADPPRGAFGGVPSAIKDNVTFAGLPCTMGSAAVGVTPKTTNSAMASWRGRCATWRASSRRPS